MSDKMQKLQVVILGSSGRVGKLLIAELESGEWPQCAYAGGSRSNTSENELNTLFQKADVAIDFTTPEATMKHLEVAKKHSTAMVIATTGLTAEQEQKITATAQNCPIVYAANTSIGVTVLQNLVEKVANLLDENFDIEINEIHHKHKVDAPSGTALALGKAAAAGRGTTLGKDAVYAREGITGARKSGNIGFSVQRGGDVVGEHTVSFFGEGERLELTHRASNRSLFAKGALKAALWVKEQPAGLYNMNDVLGL